MAELPTPELIAGGAWVTPEAATKRQEFAEGGVGFEDVAIDGLWHLSRRHIARFADGAGSESYCNLGAGTYLGAGELDGDQLRLLRRGAHWDYQVRWEGAVLLVPQEAQYDISWELAEQADMVDEVASMSAFKRTNRVLSATAIGGVRYDGFLVYGDRWAEAVAFRNQASGLQIRQATHVSAA